MKDWKMVSLEDMGCEFFSGFAFKSKDYAEDGIPIIKIGNIQNRIVKIDINGNYVPEEIIDNKVEKYFLNHNDVLIAMTGQGSVGRVGRLKLDNQIKPLLNQRVGKFVCDEVNLNIDFLFYVLSSKRYQSILFNAGTGSGQPNLSPKAILSTEIPYLSYDEQKRIADVLSALDDKIEVNNKINDNLEKQAQAIFKQWFVDFEFPDQEGEPYKTNGGEFIDSELGEIPLGWRVGRISDLVLSRIGGDWGKETKMANFISEVYCIRGADINDIVRGNKGKMPTRYILEKNYKAKKLEAHDLVIEISGGSPTQSTGRIALITDPLLNRYDKPMICTNFCRAIKPLENYSYFFYYNWRYLYDLTLMFSYENGTTGIKNLDINSLIDNERVVIPDEATLIRFNDYIENISENTFLNGSQTESLSELRDYLLPKLMSGEVRV